jgi:hypothetical protein
MEIIAIYSENHTKSINTLCGQNAEILNIKVGGRYKIPLCFKAQLNIFTHKDNSYLVRHTHTHTHTRALFCRKTEQP